MYAIVKAKEPTPRRHAMKASYQTTTNLLDNGFPIAEYDNGGHRWMSCGGKVLTEKAEQMLWKHDYLVDVIGTELDTVRSRLGLKHVWVRGH